jgi:ribonucleoside-diphosphate reductase alpha subunit
MKVLNRSGVLVPVRYDEITDRIQALIQIEPALDTSLDAARVAHNVISKIVDGIKTSELDRIAAIECMNLLWEHPDYNKLAGRLIAGDLQKKLTSLLNLYEVLHAEGQVSDEFIGLIRDHTSALESLLQHDRNYLFDYFGMSTLVNGSYLKKSVHHTDVCETPQHLFLRVALALHKSDLDAVRESYEAFSNKLCTHATPTLFHAGSERNQLASCFLLQIDDSIDDMYSVAHKCAKISKYGGGIGIAVSKIRAKGSLINTSKGRSTGMLPYLQVLDALARHVDQGGKRAGSIAIYIEPWHADIVSVIKAKHPLTLPEERANNLFYALWTNDVFMERVQAQGTWSLFCPGEHPELVELVGPAFKQRYVQLEAEGSFRSQMPAAELWAMILKSQIETGMPYLLFKDACNLKSNQRNLGTIYSSNLCAEIVEKTSSEETAVCNLASVCLPSFVSDGKFDFSKLEQTVRMLVRNLNISIDDMYYTTDCARRSNLGRRPIGIGVQGYADVFAMLGIAWESQQAKDVTERVSAWMYYAAISESNELARIAGVTSLVPGSLSDPGTTYEGYTDSPISQGNFQFDLWGGEPGFEGLDWEALRLRVMAYGVRNSLCIALMPTASTSNIMGFNESFEPFTFNLYSRRTLAGEFPLVNKYLVTELIRLGLWNRAMYERVVLAGGSIQAIPEIPADLRLLFKTARELKKVPLLELAAIRGRYVCQTQSMNLYIDGKASDVQLLHNCHMKSWKLGLKTASYYTHSMPAARPQNFAIDPRTERRVAAEDEVACENCSA